MITEERLAEIEAFLPEGWTIWPDAESSEWNVGKIDDDGVMWNLMDGRHVISEHATYGSAYRSFYRYIRNRIVLPVPAGWPSPSSWYVRNNPHTVRVEPA